MTRQRGPDRIPIWPLFCLWKNPRTTDPCGPFGDGAQHYNSDARVNGSPEFLFLFGAFGTSRTTRNVTAGPARRVMRAPAFAPIVLAAFLASPAAAKEPMAHPLQPSLRITTHGSLCVDSSHQVPWPVKKPADIRTWFSLCGSAAGTPGSAVSDPFRAPAELGLYLTGFITESSHLLVLENADTGAMLDAGATELPTGIWTLIRYRIPKSWRGNRVRLKAAFDDSKAAWMGFSEPLIVEETNTSAATLRILLRTLAYFVLLSVPFALTASIALRKGLRDPPLVLLFGLAALGVAGYLAFWCWFLSPILGRIYSVGLLVVCGACLWRSVARLSVAGRMELLAISKPWLLTLVAALVTFAAGFMYGGQEQPLAIAQVRYSHGLPMDNTLPFLLSEHIAHGMPVRPFFGDWLSSDRPPLQTGFTLLLYPFIITPRDVRYEVTAVLAQCLWLPALWALLSILQVPLRLIYLLLVATFFSGCVLLNSFYVWPKLLAAAFMIGGSALLMATPLLTAGLRRLCSLGAGAMLGLALLAHGGSIFALPGLFAALAMKGFRPAARCVGLAMGVCILLYLPWTGYQRFYDPPGDRLLKLHLAGVGKPNTDSFTHDLLEAYAHVTGQQILQTRLINLATVFDHQVEFWSNLGHFVRELPHDLVHEQKLGSAAAHTVRHLQFYCFFPTLGFMMFGPLFLVFGFRRPFRTPIWRAALFCWLYVLTTVFLWCSVLFQADAATLHVGAVLHQGTYVIVLLGMSGSLLAYWNVSPRLALILVAVQSALSILINVVYGRGAALPGALAEGIFNPAALILLIAAFLLIGTYTRVARATAGISEDGLPAMSFGRASM